MYRYKPSFFSPLKLAPPLPMLPLHPAAKSFNSTINSLSSQGAHWEVLLTCSSMLKHNTPPDAFTIPSLLKACASLHLIRQGLCFHQRAVVHGYSSDPYVASSLINMYAKFGYLSNARKVFDLMPERNVFSWTAVIGCYSRVGDVGSALCMYNEMGRKGIRPNSVTLLGVLSGVSELAHVQCLHACAVFYGFESDLNLVNSLLNVYGRHGRVEDARHLFESMDRRDIVSWNSLVSGYAHIGNLREILLLLNRMVIEGMEPDLKTYGSVVSTAATLGKLELGKLVHQLILRAGFILDIQVETSLLAMYFKCGDVNYAFRIFQQTREKDVVLWTAMISGLVQNNCADKALMVFRCMLRSGLMPSTTTIASLLAACAQICSFDMGASIHGYIVRQRMKLGIAAQNSLLTMYAKCGHLEQSYALFNMMEHKDLVSWNAIVSVFSQNDHLSKAFLLFSEMRSSLQIPDSVTLVSLLQACASTGALHQGKWIHNFIIRSCHGPCILVNTALVDMYSKCGDLRSARKCFDGMSQQDLVSWSTIIGAYGTHGRGDIALSMYSKFLHSGIEPNHVICLSVLSACSHNGLVEQGLSLFQSMKETFGIEPKLEHRSCIVDLLSRAGRVEEAYNFYNTMFPEPSMDTLGILLDACRANGNTELGDIIARDILVLKPVNSENFVQLANSYAAMNRWDGVGEAWTKMNSLGLKKLPGWSSIELHGNISTFFMNHSSHSHCDEIMLVSKTLVWEMTKLAVDRNNQNIDIT